MKSRYLLNNTVHYPDTRHRSTAPKFHDYVIHTNASTRTYYPRDGKQPDFIQSSKHIFLEWKLGEYFDNQIAFAWVSATNYARIYNESNIYHLSQRPEYQWPTSFLLSVLAIYWRLQILVQYLRDNIFCHY